MPKTKTKDNNEVRAELLALGLNPDAPALDDMPEIAERKVDEPVLAPAGVDPHTMPITDIVFDPRLLDDFPDLPGQRKKAADHVFEKYRDTRGRNKDRHSLLHGRISKFIEQVHRSRSTGTPHVKEVVRAAKPQRDLLALLAEHGIRSVDDLTRMLGGGE